MTAQLTDELSMTSVYHPQYIEDPYPLYRRIRDQGPVLWDPNMGNGGAWMITGYDPALTTLRDNVFSARRPQWDPTGQPPTQASPLRALYSQVFVTDAPVHKRLRKLLMQPFLPRAVEAMRSEIERGATALLDTALPGGEIDFMQDYAMALPSAIVCGVLGVPLTERDQFWKRILSWGLLVDEGPMSKEHPDHHLAGISKYMDYFRQQLRRREHQRTDDLMQTLADSWAAGEFDSEEELLGNLIFMLTAGQTTTAHQIGNSVLALLENPDVLATLTADPTLVPHATAELMRYDSSVQLTKRRPVREVELGGQTIRAGEEIYVWMGAAHRDPHAFTDPDRLDVNRPRTQNLALGHGAHYCLGGQLGQTINEVAVQHFVERVRNPKVDRTKIHRTETPTFRGPHTMPMTFTP